MKRYEIRECSDGGGHVDVFDQEDREGEWVKHEDVMKLVESIVRWIAHEAECESALLYTRPNWYVFVSPLLDHIRDSMGLDESVIRKWVDAANKRRED